MIGKIHLQQCSISLARLLIVFLLLVPMASGMSGCNLLSALPDKTDQTDDDKLKPEPDPGPLPSPQPDKFQEAEYWNALAELVEAGRFTNTDQIVLVAESQKSLNHVSDLSRLAEYQAKRQDVTDANKNFIANKIRGN